PIDFFFRSLADDQQHRAIAIVLSGTGSDGTRGVREIKAAGGMVMAQTPETAQHDGMPRSAIATGVVDFVLPIDQMPDRLLRYVRHGYVSGGDVPAPVSEKAPDELQVIVNLLRVRLKYDFSCYKKGTLTRRVQRRMGINHFDKMSDYAEFLRKNAEEVTALYKDLLISVTNFFRDADAWSELEKQVIASLVREHDDLPIRVWAAGCATGEEPYSLAVLLLEHLRANEKACGLQVFASDIDHDALALARSGLYPESIVADVSSERLRKFFTKGEHTYRINKEVRDAVIFAEQNLISDPPFSKLDLISCRNLLIYLEPEIQQKIFSLFHFALREGGYLFLGNSESITLQSDLFEPVSQKWRIYRRIGPARLENLAVPQKTAKTARFTPQATHDLMELRNRRIGALAQHLMLQRFAPACVLINRKAEVLFLNGPVDAFLRLPSGELATDLFAMTREGLRTKLRSAVHQAIQDNQPVVIDGVRLKNGGKYVSVRIVVEPLRQPKEAEGLLMVRFEAEGGPAALSPIPEPELTPREMAKSEPGAASDYEPIIRQLEDDLRGTREDLQNSIEELETSNEEFKAAHEEVTSINEELQSTNEELETSKEELQSLNEELQTVNSQLEQKLHELESSNNDLANLLSSTDIATIFLDRQFRIKRFTPAASRLMRVIDGDLGRSISDLVMKFTDDSLLTDAETVLQRLTPSEKVIQDNAQQFYLRRIVPYRTHDDRIDGVVITFVDITRQKSDAERFRISEERYRTVVEGSPDGIVIHQDSVIMYANPTLARIFGYLSPEELIGRDAVQTLASPKERPGLQERVAACYRGERVAPHVGWRGQRKDGSEVWIASNASAIDWEGRPAIVAFCADITELRDSLKALHQSELREQAILDTALDAVIVMDHQGRIADFNPAAEQVFGHARAEAIGKPLAELIIPPKMRVAHYKGLAHFLKTGEGPVLGQRLELSALRSDGSEFPVELSIVCIPGSDPPLFTGFLRDITDRKQAEADLKTLNEQLEVRVAERTQELELANVELRDREQQFRLLIESAPDAMVVADDAGLIVQVNQRTEELFGYPREDLLGHSVEWLVPSRLGKVHREHRSRYFRSPTPRPMGMGQQLVAM
ncbi:MAG: PAS domain S-box protein, partial [Planctomycetaceae bacterium]|nr:PAS domain S-box protein [Planctomycetaceae bacterium]